MTAAVPAPVACVRADAPPAQGGRADVTLVAIRADGTEHRLGRWSEVVEEYDRPLLSRSPDGGRVALAIGRMLRTIDVETGDTLAGRTIGGSEPSVVIGWTPGGTAVARDTDAPSGPDMPLPDGWTLHMQGALVQDWGFSGGDTGGSPLLAWSLGTPESEMLADVAEARAAMLAQAQGADRDGPSISGRRFRVELHRGAQITIVADEYASPMGAQSLHWPPVVGPEGVLLRRSGSSLEIREPEGPMDPGYGSETTTLEPWLVRPDGTVTTVPVPLAVAPLCALPDGRWLLPGGDPLWRDDAEAKISTLAVDGRVEPLLVEGAPITPMRILAAVAPEWLDPADQERGRWENDAGFWPQGARVDAAGQTLTVLLAEEPWPVDWHEPEPARWLVVQASLSGPAELRLVARGARAEGHQLVVAV